MKDIRDVWKQFRERESTLNGLVCAAGALMDEKVLTDEGIETTFACHLAGVYLLTNLARPTLELSEDPRVALISSGGMYNCRFPSWEKATASGRGSYNGMLAYSYAKRGQVLLAERMAAIHKDSKVRYTSCHPGWASTPGVDAAFGKKKSWLEPMRSEWEGAEGIAWLAAVPGEELENGQFYLDRYFFKQHTNKQHCTFKNTSQT